MVRAGPRRITVIDDAVAQKKFRQAMSESHQISASILTGTDQITGRLLFHRRNCNLDDFAQPEHRARCKASRASVLTRSPAGLCSFDGAITAHSIPARLRDRYKPNPVGPASYTTFTGPGSDATSREFRRDPNIIVV